jgi:hypothetical protein
VLVEHPQRSTLDEGVSRFVSKEGQIDFLSGRRQCRQRVTTRGGAAIWGEVGAMFDLELV